MNLAAGSVLEAGTVAEFDMARLLLTIPLLFGLSAEVVGATAEAAPTDTPSPLATGAAKAPKTKKHRAAPPAATAPAPNLNAPSMDFTGVTPETGDTADPRHGPPSNIRPTLNSNGQPAMGLGF